MSSPDDLLDEKEAAAVLRKPPGTLKQWRYLGRGPAYVRIGRNARYLRADLDAFIAEHRITPGAA